MNEPRGLPRAAIVWLAIALAALILLVLSRFVAAQPTAPATPAAASTCELQLARQIKLYDSTRSVRDLYEQQIAILSVELERLQRELTEARAASPSPGVPITPGATPKPGGRP